MQQPKGSTRRRLFFDIETSPNIGLFWQAGYKKNIDYSNIIQERAIICICYKWEDEKQVYSLQWDARQNDKKMLIEFIKVANQAVELVGHNGDKFDLAWIRTRCVFHRIDMFPRYLTIDTLKVARAKFKFNSNKLDYIAEYLGLGNKIKTEYGLWKDILLKKDKTAMSNMVTYCKKDVTLLEDVFKILNTHIEPKAHYGVFANQLRSTCPECGSDDLRKQGMMPTVSGLLKQRYQCKTCNKFHVQTVK